MSGIFQDISLRVVLSQHLILAFSEAHVTLMLASSMCSDGFRLEVRYMVVDLNSCSWKLPFKLFLNL